MANHKIVPSIWFVSDCGNLSSVIAYYKNIFGLNFVESKIISLGETPSGSAEICEVILYEQKYSFLCTEKEHQRLNDAISLIIKCENQTEIDKFWNYFTSEGKESECGWCIDKFGLRWQVIPENIDTLMAKPGAREIMMSQKKIIISEF